MSLNMLLVDDDPSIHAALAPILELEGLGMRSVTTLAEAMRVVESEPCDFVLADLSLSDARGTEGLALIAWLHTQRPDLPVVLFTARGSAEIFAEARRRGAVDAWSKDLPIPELVRRILALGRTGGLAPRSLRP